LRNVIQNSVTFIDSMSVLDELLFQQDDVHNSPIEQQSELLFNLVRENFHYHYLRNEEFRRYCFHFDFGPDGLHSIDDLHKIPLIPTSLFKKKSIYSCSPLEIEKQCSSSGTQGGRSTIYRDRITLDRFIGTVQAMYQLAPDIKFKNPFLYVLSPDTDEAQDLWFAYVLSLVEILHPSMFYVRNGKFHHDELLQDLQQIGKDQQPVLIGPPQLLNQLANIVQSTIGTLDLGAHNGYFITAGGWKKAQKDSLELTQFADKMLQTFHLSSQNEIRDCFNMVELNTVMMSCQHHNFHVPPWLYMAALDPDTLLSAPEGEMGILAFIDATSTSYPAYVLSDDLGEVHLFNSCPCGRSSRWFKMIRRVNRVESRGCAKKIDNMLAQ
jgi:long-chain-fatty-acid---luciferin-component ligase